LQWRRSCSCSPECRGPERFPPRMSYAIANAVPRSPVCDALQVTALPSNGAKPAAQCQPSDTLIEDFVAPSGSRSGTGPGRVGLAGLSIHEGQQRGGNGPLQGTRGRRGRHRANAKGWGSHGLHLVGRITMSMPSTASVGGHHGKAHRNWDAVDPNSLIVCAVAVSS
jgi:hypothetical protein